MYTLSIIVIDVRITLLISISRMIREIHGKQINATDYVDLLDFEKTRLSLSLESFSMAKR